MGGRLAVVSACVLLSLSAADPDALFVTGEWSEAYPLYEERLAQLRSQGHAETEDAARALGRLVRLAQLRFLGQETTEALAREHLALCRSVYGEESPETASAMLGLARSLESADDETERQGLQLRALEIHESTLPEGSFTLAMTRCASASFLRGLTQEERLAIKERALASMRNALARDPLEESMCMNSRAIQLGDWGGTSASASAWEELLAFRRRMLGEEHPITGFTLHNLANHYAGQGRTARALEIRRRVLAIWKEKLGEESGLVPLGLMHIANTLRRRGEFGEAYRILTRIRDLKPSEPNEWVFANLSAVSADLGEFERALEFLDVALAIRESRLPNDGWHCADMRRERADLLLTLGRLDEACPEYERYLRITELERESASEILAPGLEGLMRCAIEESPPALERARGHAMEILSIRRKSHDAGDIRIARALRDLARIEMMRGDAERALELLDEALTVEPEMTDLQHWRARSLAMLGRSGEALYAAFDASDAESRRLELALSLPERRARALALSETRSIDVALTILSGTKRPDPLRVRDAWERVIDRRTRSLDASARRHAASHAIEHPGLRLVASKLHAARRRAGLIVFSGSGPVKADLDEALDEIDRLERDMAELVPKTGSWSSPRVPGSTVLRSARDSTPLEGALAAFVVFERGLAPGTRTAWYGAFLADSRSGPRFLPLAPKARVDPLVSRWRSGFGAQEGHALRELLLAPLFAESPRANRWRLVTDGTLALLNFYALPGREDPFLIDEGRVLHVASSERDLTPRSSGARRGEGLLLVAAPDFEGVLEAGPHAKAAIMRSSASACRSSGSFAPLAGAKAEADAIARLWPEESTLVRLEGAAATPDQLARHARGKAVVHLATHGFYAGEECAAVEPLLRAGLALAGANREGGILSAEEAASLDLNGVDWVVLSACETGLGSATSGEGVLGLRRALRIAGASTLVASLWPTRDSTARWMMTRLYEERIVRNRSTEDALFEATRALLEELRARGGSPSPADWAAFVASGDPR